MEAEETLRIGRILYEKKNGIPAETDPIRDYIIEMSITYEDITAGVYEGYVSYYGCNGNINTEPYEVSSQSKGFKIEPANCEKKFNQNNPKLDKEIEKYILNEINEFVNSRPPKKDSLESRATA